MIIQDAFSGKSFVIPDHSGSCGNTENDYLQVIETLKKDGLEYSLDNEVLGMIYDLSYELSKNLNNKSAMYCLDVLYDLTGDEKYLREKEYLE
jgi:hypothetical protein